MLQQPPSDQTPEEPGTPRAQRVAPTAPQVNVDPNLRAGAKLAAARQQLGLSVQEVAERIRVRREFLEALEAMNIKLLPGKAYALAFLRSYARALGLDEQAIVEQFQDESALTREDAQKQIRNPQSKPHPERPWLAAVALVLIAAGFVGWRALKHEEAAEAPAQRQAEMIQPTTRAGVTTVSAPAASAARVVEIKALTDGWLEARGPDGTVFLSRTLQAGDVYRPDPSPGWTLHARDGGSFEVFLNGTSVGLLGQAGAPVLGRQIDAIQPIDEAALHSPRS